jgi:hypothetical protein
MSAVEAVARLRKGEISPLELVEASAQRIGEIEPAVNALPTLCLDRAREHARHIMQGGAACEARRRGGLARRPAGLDQGPHRRRGRADHLWLAALRRSRADGSANAAAGDAYILVHGRAFRWSAQGYEGPLHIPRPDALLTPPSTLGALRAGYRPALHPSIPASTDPGLVHCRQPRRRAPRRNRPEPC